MPMLDGGILDNLFDRARNVGLSCSSVTVAVAFAQQNNSFFGVDSNGVLT